jgi:hypothetical protein
MGARPARKYWQKGVVCL